MSQKMFFRIHRGLGNRLQRLLAEYQQNVGKSDSSIIDLVALSLFTLLSFSLLDWLLGRGGNSGGDDGGNYGDEYHYPDSSDFGGYVCQHTERGIDPYARDRGPYTAWCTNDCGISYPHPRRSCDCCREHDLQYEYEDEALAGGSDPDTGLLYDPDTTCPICGSWKPSGELYCNDCSNS